MKVAVVTFEGDYFARAYVEETGVEWPVLVDAERSLYRAYGMERGRCRDLLGFSAWWVYLKLVLKGRKVGKSHGDVKQLGGDVLVDPGGVVRLHHVGSGPANRPAVGEILDGVKR